MVRNPRGTYSQAAAVLNAGCPLDLNLSAFPVTMCTRTLIGKSPALLWRTAADCFRVEIARSYSAYIWHFLNDARREFMVEGSAVRLEAGVDSGASSPLQ